MRCLGKYRERGATLDWEGGGGDTVSDLIFGGGGAQDTFSF